MNALRRIGDSFYKANAILLGLLGIIISGLAFYATPQTVFSIKIVLPTAILLVILLTIVIHAFIVASKDADNYLPKGIHARSFRMNGQQSPLILFHQSSLFSPGQIVTIFRNSNSYEEQIGTGHILAVQQDRVIQVVVTDKIESTEGTWESIMRNEKGFLTSLGLKPATVSIVNEG